MKKHSLSVKNQALFPSSSRASKIMENPVLGGFRTSKILRTLVLGGSRASKDLHTPVLFGSRASKNAQKNYGRYPRIKTSVKKHSFSIKKTRPYSWVAPANQHPRKKTYVFIKKKYVFGKQIRSLSWVAPAHQHLHKKSIRFQRKIRPYSRVPPKKRACFLLLKTCLFY